MAAYYNEFDPKTAAWLRELIKAGLIADGEVDTRSITDVSPADVRGFTQCHFFAGIGGWSYALRLAGWPDRRRVWTGSCPCQPWSAAGKGLEATDSRHLWPAWFQLIRECAPVVVFGEQVAGAAGRAWFDAVQDDLESLGYAVGPVDLPACSVGAFHRRSRLWFVGDASGAGLSERERDGRLQPGAVGAFSRKAPERPGDAGGMADATGERHERERLLLQQREPRQDCLEVAGSGEAGCVADSEYAERRSLHVTGQDGRDWANPGREEAHGQPGTRRQVRCVADTDGGESGDGDVQRGRRHDEQPKDAAIGFWDAVEWLACTDGKARPVEPGTFPLAHGLPARVGRLRGYGNAIVPQVAAEVIGAYMDLLPADGQA